MFCLMSFSNLYMLLHPKQLIEHFLCSRKISYPHPTQSHHLPKGTTALNSILIAYCVLLSISCKWNNRLHIYLCLTLFVHKNIADSSKLMSESITLFLC